MDMPRILVVDDEEDLCEILKFNLEIEGYEVDTAFSAEEALKKDLSVYQLLLLDVMMGEISGFKMASILRKDESTANTPASTWVQTIIFQNHFPSGRLSHVLRPCYAELQKKRKPP